MPNFTSQQIKRALVDAGFIVFRTLPAEVVVAERVRENLIMDSGVRLTSEPALEVRVVLRLQRGDFPGEDDAKLFERVRARAAAALAGGFHEIGHQTRHVTDPGDSTRMLDTFYELIVSRRVDDLDSAIEGVRFAFTLDRLGHSGP